MRVNPGNLLRMGQGFLLRSMIQHLPWKDGVNNTLPPIVICISNVASGRWSKQYASSYCSIPALYFIMLSFGTTFWLFCPFRYY